MELFKNVVLEPELVKYQEFDLFQDKIVVDIEQSIAKIEKEVLPQKPASVVTKSIDLTSPLPSKPKTIQSTDMTKQISLFPEYKSP